MNHPHTNSHACDTHLLNPPFDVTEPNAEELMSACVTAEPPPQPWWDLQTPIVMVDTASDGRSMESFSAGGDFCVTADAPPGADPDHWQYFFDGISSESRARETEVLGLNQPCAAVESAIPLGFLLTANHGDSMLRDMAAVQEWHGGNTWFQTTACYIHVAVLAMTAAFSVALILTEPHESPIVAATGIFDPGNVFPGY